MHLSFVRPHIRHGVVAFCLLPSGHDTAIQSDQGRPAIDLINQFLKSATGAAIVGKQRVRVRRQLHVIQQTNAAQILTPADIAAFSRQRRADCKAHNPQFTLKLLHKLFSANNNSILYDVFGGRVDDLRTFLIEERFPQGWQPRYTKRYGYTMMALNFRSLQVSQPVVNITAY
jgi:hypothetical protein